MFTMVKNLELRVFLHTSCIIFEFLMDLVFYYLRTDDRNSTVYSSFAMDSLECFIVELEWGIFLPP